MLDLDALGAAEKENWVWHGADCLKPEYERCLVQLSRGGADADVVREFDLEAKAFVKDGFFLPEAKNGVGWLDADTLYVGTDFGPGSMTSSGYPRIAKVWKRGTPLAAAETVYEGRAEDMSVAAFRDHTKGFERDFVYRGDHLLHERDVPAPRRQARQDREAGQRERLGPPRPARRRAAGRLDGGGKTYPAGALLAADFEGFLKGERRFDVLFEPTDRKSLAGFSPTRNHVLAQRLDNVSNRVYVLTRADGRGRASRFPACPSSAR